MAGPRGFVLQKHLGEQDRTGLLDLFGRKVGSHLLGFFFGFAGISEIRHLSSTKNTMVRCEDPDSIQVKVRNSSKKTTLLAFGDFE